VLNRKAGAGVHAEALHALWLLQSTQQPLLRLLCMHVYVRVCVCVCLCLRASV